VVCDVEEAEGHVWFAGRRGIHAIRRDNLEAFFAGKTTQVSALSLGRSDGLASTEVQLKSQPAMARTDDGQLWVATARGVAHFHPKEVLSRLRPPPMAVDSLKLDGRPFPLGRGPISLPPGSGRVVEIAFSSLSFVAPERVKFHYRLTGPDGPEDRVSDDTIQGYAVFTHLRPGRHVFTVSARSGNGLVSDPPAKLEFDIEPQFYETGWFRVAMGLFGLTTMAGFISFRLSRADRAAALQQERRLSAERQRIARDMHDELGAELTRLAIRVGNQTTGGNSSQPSASQTARGLLRSLDETVWVVNPDKDSLESMVNYLGTWIREYFTETQIGLSIDLPATIPQLAVSAEWRHHLLRAVKEACHNILKHANATHVEFSIQVADGGRTLELRLGDDGCGFEVQEGTGALGGDSSFQLGGNGLKNLRRRAEQLNAVLKIESAPDHGARIHLIVPLPVSLKG